MADSQSIKFRLLVLTLAVLLFSLNAEASVIPYWGDRSCYPGEDCEYDPFPAMFARFINPETHASTIEGLSLSTGIYGIWFRPIETEAYRLSTGCLTCDVYSGALLIFNVDGGFHHPASVYTPIGFWTDTDRGDSRIAFNGDRIYMLTGAVLEAWTDDPRLNAQLGILPNRTWQFGTYPSSELGGGSVTHGTWSEINPRQSGIIQQVPEPHAFWLLIPGITLLLPHYRARKTPPGPPAG